MTTDPRHETAAKPLRAVTFTGWQAADSTATVEDVRAALEPLGIFI